MAAPLVVIPGIFPFNNVATTTIGYSETMRGIYGRVPGVHVYYREENGEYVKAIHPAGISLTMNHGLVDTITVDHGGSNTGFIKIV